MNRNKTVSEALLYGKKLLIEQNIADAGFVASLFLGHVTGMSKAQLLAEGSKELLPEEQNRYQQMLSKRILGHPAQYLLGEWEFMGLPFYVEEGVLIPRADTETLVEAVLEKAKEKEIRRILDIGTGTGCIPISLCHYGKMEAFGVDINPQAIQLAKKNAAYNQVEATWFLSDLFSNIPEAFQGTFDGLVSNPPYIKKSEIPHLMREVRDFEPPIALDGGDDGLDFYRRIVAQAPLWLTEGGWIFFEIGCQQGLDVSSLLEKDFTDIQIIKDLSGLDRVVLGRKKER